MTIRKLKILLAMAYDRQAFISKVRDRFLLGAYGEFMCRQIALAVGKPDSWSKEVGSLSAQVHLMMDPETKVTVKRRDDLLKEAMLEAMREAPSYVVSSRTKVADYYPKMMPKIKRLEFDAGAEFVKMVDEFLPEYSELLAQLIDAKGRM